MAEAVVEAAGRMAAEAAVVGRTEAAAVDTRAAVQAANRTLLPMQAHPAQAGIGGIRSMAAAPTTPQERKQAARRQAGARQIPRARTRRSISRPGITSGRSRRRIGGAQQTQP